MGQTLSAGTSGITDANGLDNVSFAYQWIRVNTDSTETDISGATGGTHTLVAADQGKTIKVRVSFTDDAGNDETVTSAATAEVEAALTAELQRVPDSAQTGLERSPSGSSLASRWDVNFQDAQRTFF